MIDSIRKIFVEETSGNLSHISQVLANAQPLEMPKEVIEKVFLTMHTIKGSAPMFGFGNLPMVSLPVEKTFARLKNGQMQFSPEIGERTKDAINIILDALNRNSDDHLPETMQNSDLVNFFTGICS